MLATLAGCYIVLYCTVQYFENNMMPAKEDTEGLGTLYAVHAGAKIALAISFSLSEKSEQQSTLELICHVLFDAAWE